MDEALVAGFVAVAIALVNTVQWLIKKMFSAKATSTMDDMAERIREIENRTKAMGKSTVTEDLAKDIGDISTNIALLNQKLVAMAADVQHVRDNVTTIKARD